MRRPLREALRAAATASSVVAVWLAARTAEAGGFEFPDNGTQALGRGAAFTAKADDGTAMFYNVAGFARQRGTRLLLNGNVVFHGLTFQRDGQYADNPMDPKTPWGGQNYPAVNDTGPPFFAPLFVAQSDFGLDRWTFAAGVFGPSGVGNRTYPYGIDRRPSPGRYDLVQAKPTIIYPTLAAAYRLLPWLDVGLGLSLAIGNFDLTNVSYSDLGSMLCPNPEYASCDVQNRLTTHGTSFTPSFGVMARPFSWLAAGANVRLGYTINSSGTVTATPPEAAPIKLDPAAATFSTSIPVVLRLGVRAILMKHAKEKADAELDFTYEGWGAAQHDGPQIGIPKLGIFTDINTQVAHGYHDTFSIRAGGAYSMDVGDGTLTLRGGIFYDAAATDAAYTRIDFDTLDKVGLTVGAGYTMSGITLNVAAANMFEPSRTVTDGVIRPVNGAAHGAPVDANGALFDPVNNGTYSGHSAILSFGIEFLLDEFFGFAKKPHYMNDYEDPDFVPVAKGDKAKDKDGHDKTDTGDDADTKNGDATSGDKPASGADGTNGASGDKPDEATPNIPKTPAPAPAPADAGTTKPGSPGTADTSTAAPTPKKPPKKPKKPKKPAKKNDFEL